MIVCHCRGVSDRKIRQAIRQGACSRGEISRTCHAGGICGGCGPAIEALLQSERGREAARSLAAVAEPAAAAS